MKIIQRICVVGSISALTLLTACAGGMGGMGGGSGLGAVGQHAANAAVGSMVNSAIGGVGGGGVMNAIIQSMAQSVLHGQIGQQVTPVDQNFRLQQLGGVMQSGAIDQPQQWSNPQTGNTVALQPLGQSSVDPNTQQNCRELEEVFTSKTGASIREVRRACQDQTGRWVLVQ